MNLEIGMYVRTINGKIWVITSQKAISGHRKDIINASYNIIDLIEVGDYVNGCLVTNRRASVNERLSGHPKQIFILKQEGNYNDAHFEWLKKEDIKTIVTREQFSQMEYKVKE